MKDSELLQDVANRLRQLEDMRPTGSPALQSLITELGGELVGACDRVCSRWSKVLHMALLENSSFEPEEPRFDN
jgi:hypothetical protein